MRQRFVKFHDGMGEGLLQNVYMLPSSLAIGLIVHTTGILLPCTLPSATPCARLHRDSSPNLSLKRCLPAPDRHPKRIRLFQRLRKAHKLFRASLLLLVFTSFASTFSSVDANLIPGEQSVREERQDGIFPNVGVSLDEYFRAETYGRKPLWCLKFQVWFRGVSSSVLVAPAPQADLPWIAPPVFPALRPHQ